MSDLIAGPPAGGGREDGGGPRSGDGPPLVLFAALAVAVLISMTVLVLFGRFGDGGDGGDAGARGSVAVPTAAAAREERNELTVTLRGSGDGRIQIMPGDISCSRTCKHEFDSGTRLIVTAEAASGSSFEGWGDACDGSGRCSILMHDKRSLSATFDKDSAEPPCEEDGAAVGDPACAEEELDALDEDLDPEPVGDCADGRDNDGDGLTDAAQDPDCLEGISESGTATGSGRPPRDCDDGRDNDRDGLTDRAQDPGCDGDGTEAD